MASEEPQAVDVEVPPEQEVGTYANFAAVSSQGPFDITLDFIQLVPGGGIPKPIVVSRVKLPVGFLMPLMQTLSSHLSNHEQFAHQFDQDVELPTEEHKDEEEES